ncbi:MAG TPA: polysaccharide deacetylase family protein [Euzebyales bacterium]
MERARAGHLAAHWGITVVVAGIVLGTLSMAAPDAEPAAAPPPPARSPCPQGPVALTFDDGPSRRNTPRVEAILAEHRAPATFFVIGQSVDERPRQARQLARAGHRIHNHTYDHVDLTERSDDEIIAQVTRTNDALAAADLPRSHLVRPPFGAVNKRVRRTLRSQGYRVRMWSVDTRDWQDDHTPDEIVDTVTAQVGRGAVVLLHDTEKSDATVVALPQVIRTVRSRGHCLGVIDERGRVVRAELRR